MHLALEDADRIEEWRKRAQRLRALAKITHDATTRSAIASLAAQWDVMAAQAESTLRQRLSAGHS